MKDRFKTIGILGGIGPSASASMYSRVISYMQSHYGAWDDNDFPKVMVYSTALEGFDESGIADPDLVEKSLVDAAKKLESMGSDLIVVACNTVHYFDKQIEQAIGVPLVHMIDEACRDVSRRGIKKIGIVCSQSTRDLGLYSNALSSYGIEPLVCTDGEQAKINKVIMNVMAGKQGPDDIVALDTIFKRYQDSGAEAVILGCTEIPLAISQKDSNLELIDANDVVVSQAIEIAIKKTSQPEKP